MPERFTATPEDFAAILREVEEFFGAAITQGYNPKHKRTTEGKASLHGVPPAKANIPNAVDFQVVSKKGDKRLHEKIMLYLQARGYHAILEPPESPLRTSGTGYIVHTERRPAMTGRLPAPQPPGRLARATKAITAYAPEIGKLELGMLTGLHPWGRAKQPYKTETGEWTLAEPTAEQKRLEDIAGIAVLPSTLLAGGAVGRLGAGVLGRLAPRLIPEGGRFATALGRVRQAQQAARGAVEALPGGRIAVGAAEMGMAIARPRGLVPSAIAASQAQRTAELLHEAGPIKSWRETWSQIIDPEEHPTAYKLATDLPEAALNMPLAFIGFKAHFLSNPVQAAISMADLLNPAKFTEHPADSLLMYALIGASSGLRARSWLKAKNYETTRALLERGDAARATGDVPGAVGNYMAAIRRTPEWQQMSLGEQSAKTQLLTEILGREQMLKAEAAAPAAVPVPPGTPPPAPPKPPVLAPVAAPERLKAPEPTRLIAEAEAGVPAPAETLRPTEWVWNEADFQAGFTRPLPAPGVITSMPQRRALATKVAQRLWAKNWQTTLPDEAETGSIYFLARSPEGKYTNISVRDHLYGPARPGFVDIAPSSNLSKKIADIERVAEALGRPYEGLTPGTEEWMRLWRARPDLQGEMAEYSKRVGPPVPPSPGEPMPAVAMPTPTKLPVAEVAPPALKQGEKLYYIASREEFTPVGGKPTVFPGWEEYKFFTHKAPFGPDEGKWIVSEARSGLAVSQAQFTMKEAVANALARLNRAGKQSVGKLIEQAVERQGFPPSPEAPRVAPAPVALAPEEAVPPALAGELPKPPPTEYSPAILQAFADWRSGRAYIDNAGNYHLRPEGQTTGRGPVAPWNKEAKGLFRDSFELSQAASATVPPPPGEPARAAIPIVEEVVQAARERLRRKWQTLRAVAPELSRADIEDFTVIARDAAKRGVRNLQEWTAELARDFGERVTRAEPQLAAIWAQAQAQAGKPEGAPSLTTAAKNAITETEREVAGLPPILRNAYGKHTETIARGRSKVRSGEISPGALLDSVEKDPRPLSGEETVAALYDKMRLQSNLKRLRDQLDAAIKGGGDETALREQIGAAETLIDRYHRMFVDTGTQSGGALEFRKALLAEDTSLEGYLQRKRQLEGRALTESETAELQAEHGKFVELQAKYEALEKADKERRLALGLPETEPPIPIPRARAPRKPTRPLLKTAQDFLHADYGAQNRIFTTEMREAARARLAARAASLHSGIDPTLVADIAIEIGYVVESKARFSYDALSRYLKQTYKVNEEEVKAAFRLATDKGRNAERLERLHRRMAEAKAGKEPPLRMPAPTPNLELMTAKAAWSAQKAHMDALTKPAPQLDTYQRVMEYANIPRTLLTMADLGHLQRQLGMLQIRENRIWRKAARQAIELLFSERNLPLIRELRRSDPEYGFARLARLDELSERPRSLAGKEETFIGAAPIEKMAGWKIRGRPVPVLSHIGRAVRAGERSYMEAQNTARFDTFYKYRRLYGNRYPLEDYRVLAEFLNNATGRGSLGSLSHSAGLLANIFFSPRWNISRARVWTYAFRGGLAGKVARQNLGSYLGSRLAFLGILAAAGVKVGIDPDEREFGQIQIGKTGIDIFAGERPLVKLLARAVMYQYRRLTGQQQRSDPVRTGAQFLRGKLAPLGANAWSAYIGKNIIGEPYDLAHWPNILKETTLPIFMQDIWEGYEGGGWGNAMLIAPLSFVGFGAITYREERLAAARVAPRRLIRRGITGRVVRR